MIYDQEQINKCQIIFLFELIELGTLNYFLKQERKMKKIFL